MNITDVRLIKIQGHSRLKAIAAITIDECFVVHELRIIEGDKGLFVAMPSIKRANGEYRDIAHPINKETRQLIEETVIEVFNKTDEPTTRVRTETTETTEITEIAEIAEITEITEITDAENVIE